MERNKPFRMYEQNTPLNITDNKADGSTSTVLDSLISTEFRAKYDAAAKELLEEKVFLALIMKFCVWNTRTANADRRKEGRKYV